MFWLSFICAAIGYGFAIFAAEMPIKLLCLCFGIPGLVFAILGLNRAKDDSLVGIILVSLNAVLSICSLLIGIFFLWVFIAGGPAVM